MKKVGLIINPVAGMGGRVGLKGTDGNATLQEAIARGARPEAGLRAAEALRVLAPKQGSLCLLTSSGEMGADVAESCGFAPEVVYRPRPRTGPQDTVEAVREILGREVELFLFAGGDGTARDISRALGPDSEQAVIGIPAGVKIHSAVYATTPQNAGELARLFLEEGSLPLRRAEVMDIDEDAFRQGHLSARLHGYLNVPCAASLMQHLKVGGAETEQAVLEGIARQVVEQMDEQSHYIIGPGSTTMAIMAQLDLEGTLLGVDVVRGGKLVAADANELDLLALPPDPPQVIVVTVIGGQGYVFGRGNQQVSPAVIRRAGRANIWIVAARDKILALEDGHLLVDSGDETLNKELRGYHRIITGYGETLVYPLR